VLAHQLAQVGGLQLQRGADGALGRQLAVVVPQLYSALLELPPAELGMACTQLQEQPCIWVSAAAGRCCWDCCKLVLPPPASWGHECRP
jgi:hypothetical protein